jgi:hypothetical protein
MTAYEWFTGGQAILMTLATLLVFIAYRAFLGGQWIATVDARILAIETRMERAGGLTSDLATEMQAMPERLRQDFVSRELFAAHERLPIHSGGTRTEVTQDLIRRVERLEQECRTWRNERGGHT